MPIGISNVVAYCSVGPVWVILFSVIIILYSDVPTSTYCYVSCYPFPLEEVDIRFQL